MTDGSTDVSEAVLSVPFESFADLCMEGLYEHCTAAGLHDFSELVCSGGGCILHVVTERPLPADAVRSLPYVAWWEPIRDGPARAISIGKIQPSAVDASIDSPAEHGVATTEHSLDDDDTLTISMVGNRADLAERVREYEAAGASPTIERIAAYDGAADTLDTVTERQETVLREAHERGYFEVPREATTAEIGSALDLDDSTVAEHLQRAQRSILDELLST